MTNLNAANIGMNKYCGPAVLSILTGKSTDECARVISRISGEYNITGVNINHLLQAADRLGFDQKLVSSDGSLFVTLCKLSTCDGMYIITLPNHYVVIEVKEKNIYFCDNHTKEPIPAAASARLLQKVIHAHQVIKRPEVVIPPQPPKPKPDPNQERFDRINVLQHKILNTENEIILLMDSLRVMKNELESLLGRNNV